MDGLGGWGVGGGLDYGGLGIIYFYVHVVKILFALIKNP